MPILKKPSNRLFFEVVTVILGFSALTLLGTYPLLIEAKHALPNDLGDPLLNTWILGWNADRILHGFHNLWNAPNFFPYPNTLTYSENLIGIALFTAPIQWISSNPVLAYNAAIFLSYVIAGSGMYLLALSITGSRLGAIVAGIAFAFLPYRISQLSHLQVLTYGWMPIGLFALHRYFSLGSRIALVGFVVAFLFQALSNLYYLYFFAIPVILLAGAELIRGTRVTRKAFAELSAAAGVILLAFAPIANAYLKTHAAQDFEWPKSAFVQFSADIASYAHVSSRLLIWGDTLPAGKAEAQLFPGLTLITLAIIGLGMIVFVSKRNMTLLNQNERFNGRLYGLIGLVAFVLSLGPTPTAFGQVLLSTSPYEWLQATVPGFDGLRVPARLVVVVYLSLAVLASIGTTIVVRRISKRAGLTICIFLSSAIFIEGYAGPMRMSPFDPSSDVDKFNTYEWIKVRPEGAVLELPLGYNGEPSVEYNALYQFASLQHKHPVLNGFSGYKSALFGYLGSPWSPLLDLNHFSDLLQGLRKLGVRYLVVNEEKYGNRSDARATLAAINNQKDQLIGKVTFGSTTIFWLSAWEKKLPLKNNTLYELPTSAFQVSTSHQARRWPLAVDRDVDTRWLTGFRQRGNEWIEITFPNPLDLGMVRMSLTNRSLGDYPRRLFIESIDSKGETHQLYNDGVLEKLLTGLVRNSKRIDIDIPLSSNQTSTLRISQTSNTNSWYWSIHEFSLWIRDPPQ